MHALGKFLQREIDARGWRVSDLVAASDLSKQTVYNLFEDKRPRMDRLPQRRTISGLARALGLPETDILAAAAEAMGAPGPETSPASRPIQDVSDEELLQELARRLQLRNCLQPADVANEVLGARNKYADSIGELAKAGPGMHRAKRSSQGEESRAASGLDAKGLSRSG